MVLVRDLQSALGLIVLISLAACATAPDRTPSSRDEAASPSATVGVALYACGGPPFAPETLNQPSDNLDDQELVAAFHNFLAHPNIRGERLPKAGWRVIGRDETHAWFLGHTDGGPPFHEAYFKRFPDGWRVQGWGGCQPYRVREGFNPAAWTLDLSAGPPTHEDSEFGALVSELACHGFESEADRIATPEVVYTDSDITVTFIVRAASGDAVSGCPGTAPVPVRVELVEPIGRRRLLDGSIYPPNVVAWPAGSPP